MEKTSAAQVMTFVLLVYMVIQPIFGALSDRIGRKANMILYSGIGMLITVPLMTFLGKNQDPYLAFALITLALAVISFYTGISGIVKAELFPTEVRALGVGLAYALANATFGGTAEYVALWFKEAGIESTFFWYVTVMLAIAFIASLIMPNPKVHGYLDGAGTVEEALGASPDSRPPEILRLPEAEAAGTVLVVQTKVTSGGINAEGFRSSCSGTRE